MPTYSGVTISQLEELTNVQDDDLLLINDVSSGGTKKISRSNFLFNAGGAGSTEVSQNITDSATGIVVAGGGKFEGDSRINGDLEVENEIIAGGDISTSGNIAFGSITDYVNDITALRFSNTAADLTNYDSSIPTNVAVRNYIASTVSTSGFSRQIKTGETGPLAGNDSVDINISLFKGYILYSFQCDSACWVRFYTDSAARDADVGRDINTLATDSSGLIVEFKTTGARLINLSPPVFGYNNSVPVRDTIPIKVVNRKAFTSPNINIALSVLKTEV